MPPICLQLTIHYTGRIASSGKLFESNVGAKPFKFRIGKKEVIQGWDVGINGSYKHDLHSGE